MENLSDICYMKFISCKYATIQAGHDWNPTFNHPAFLNGQLLHFTKAHVKQIIIETLLDHKNILRVSHIQLEI
jgi:hypothetical protein